MKDKEEILAKMKLTDRKKKPRFLKSKQPAHRPSIQSNYSVISLSDVTEESLEVWRGLPQEIRQDPSLASFRKKHEKLLGTKNAIDEGKTRHDSNGDYDPLETYLSEDESPALKKNNELTVIKINKAPLADIESASPLEAETKFTFDKDQVDKAEEELNNNVTGHKQQNKYVKYFKQTLLIICWIVFTFFLMIKSEKELLFRQLAISEAEIKTYQLKELPINPRIKFIFKGAFLTDHYDATAKDYMQFYLTLHDADGNILRNISTIYSFATAELAELDHVKQIRRNKVIPLAQEDFDALHNENATMKVNFYTNLEESFSINIAYDPSPLNKDVGIICAAVVLCGLYVLIIWELVHRTFAAIVASTLAVGILAAMNERPTMHTIISWLDTETLLLLFGMMILVAVLAETGVFDYLAVYAFKITNGKVWPLIICLCVFTAVVSSFLDNVTTILLMTPVTIRLCEVMELNPVPILMITVIYSNIGGTATPVGDPPNVIIISNSYISKSGINFTNFTIHMTFGVILVMVQTYYQLRFKFKKVSDLRFTEPQDVQKLRHEITVWQRAAATLSAFSKDEEVVRKTLIKKVERLQRELKKKLTSGSVPTESYQATLEELQQKYPIKNKTLLIKSMVTLVFVISFFFLHSAPHIQKLSLGWTALLGAVLLLILYDREDMEAVLSHVEWATLLFFAALFVLMEALSELGLIEWIGKQAVTLITLAGENSRLAVAILIILWISALASAFVDNIPFTTMMIKIVISLSENESLNLPLQPLVWALALGACLGGNGTLIGASANVVCAGVAEQHGYKFTFVEFFKLGFPVMIGGIIVTTFYLMVCHVLFTWH
ncbi:hypothetical protein PVAND_016621 [Polypedilum vanderplanki]|uniref:Citrate transporter-like domain-containing protein n=1 Tax=Polypedilum vanderplanki TaxID=319348 RepID=A0A9J6BFN4_POLVA|nr:hypothetical protein PVAND_016621 [Polypedilum vanderplanki]